MKRVLITIGIATLIAGSVGCRDDGSDTSEGASSSSDEQAIKLVIPSFKTTPSVELTYKISPLDESAVEAVRKPIGNVVYLALRECPQAYPAEDSEEIAVAALEFKVDGGKVSDVQQRDPKLRSEKASPVGEDARACLFDNVDGSTVEFPDEADGQLETGSFEIVAQAEVSRTK